MTLQVNYLMKLDQYLSVRDNVHLKPNTIREYSSFRDSEYEKLKIKIEELTKKLRDMIQIDRTK
jgi:hypothetical protein